MSEILENTIEEFRLDKSKWKLTRFGDVAIQQKGKVDRENTSLTRYIKGEHMGSEDLHIRKWGDLTDEYLGPAFIRKFEKGDILYGSRRTYLRKVAVADFDGITSNTTFVIKANEENIDKRLLPFIMMSEGFTENSIKNSKGSVNPYINWKDIAKYEFLLPPKDQQAKLAELLWAMDEVIERENEVLEKLNINYSAEKKEIYKSNANTTIILGESVEILSGFAFKSKMFNKNEEGKPLIRIRDISECKIETFYSGEYDDKYLITKGDLVVGMDGDFIMNTWDNKDALLNQRILKISLKKETPSLLFSYIKHFLQLELDKIHRGVGATTVKHLAVSDVRKIKLPIPEDNLKTVIKKLDLISDNIFNLEFKIQSSKALQKSLINQVF